jgi:hypothetical protein
MVQGGYGNLFAKILAGIPGVTRENTLVTGVTKQANKVRVTTMTGDVERYQEFDRVVLACDFSTITQTPVTSLLSSAIDITLFASLLFTSTHKLCIVDLQRMSVDVLAAEAFDAPIRVVSRCDGIKTNGVYWYWSVAYVSPSTDNKRKPRLSDSDLTNSLLGSIRSACPTETILHKEYLKVHVYNVRFSAEAERKGLPRTIEALQGRDGIWYSGGLMSHWDVHSIYEQVATIAESM